MIAGAPHPALGRVELDVLVPQHRGQRGLGAAIERADTRHEHWKVEGLGQVVVGAELQSVDEIVHGPGGCEHEHAGPAIRLHHAAADLVAVHARQVAVEHDHVVVGLECTRQTRRAVEGDIDSHVRSPEPHPDRLSQLGIVFDHQHPHRAPCSHLIRMIRVRFQLRNASYSLERSAR